MASGTEDLNDSWVELHFNNNNMADLTKESSTDLLTDSQTDNLANAMSQTRTDTPTDWLTDIQSDPQICFTGPSLMEKLLMDAQRESRNPSCVQSREPSCNVSRTQSCNTSRPTSRCPSLPHSSKSSLGGSSPKSPPSPTPYTELSSERDTGTEWIWDWSSRPELVQSFDSMNERFRHPMKKKRSGLSMRNSEIIRKTSIFSWANLPTLLFTHAATFFLGAAAVLIYVKKYCNLPTVAQTSLSALD